MFYDDGISSYANGYNPSCVSTIHFSNLYVSFNNTRELKEVYKKLFYGTQTREVFINAPFEFAAHYFDD